MLSPQADVTPSSLYGNLARTICGSIPLTGAPMPNARRYSFFVVATFLAWLFVGCQAPSAEPLFGDWHFDRAATLGGLSEVRNEAEAAFAEQTAQPDLGYAVSFGADGRFSTTVWSHRPPDTGTYRLESVRRGNQFNVVLYYDSEPNTPVRYTFVVEGDRMMMQSGTPDLLVHLQRQ